MIPKLISHKRYVLHLHLFTAYPNDLIIIDTSIISNYYKICSLYNILATDIFKL